MFNPRLRQAELALADARLDEAFELARTDELRQQPRGQELIGRLARAFAARAKGHYLADRTVEALADCDRGTQLAGNLPEIAEVRVAVVEAVQRQQAVQHQQHRAVATARELIEIGQLSAGQRVLAAVPPDSPGAARMQDDVQRRRKMLESALSAAAVALERDDPQAAMEELAGARGADPDDRRISELERSVSQSLQHRISAAIQTGRLDLADQYAQRLAPLDDGVEAAHLLGGLSQLQSARAAIDAGRPRDACEIVRRLTADFPDAGWLGQAAAHLKQACDSLDELRAGPLGRLSAGNAMESHAVATAAPAPAVKTTARSGPAIGSKFFLQVDGAGCHLVLRSPCVTIGPVSSSKVPDVGLVADPSTQLVTIERNEDDYFVRGASAMVADRPAASAVLLSSGDRIALSARCRLTFVQPNPASTTAVLDLNGCRFPRGDVRRAVLLDRDLIIGPGPAAHVRVDALAEPVILNMRDGRLMCGTTQPITVNGGAFDRSVGIVPGQTVRVGNLAFVVTAA